MMIGAMAGLSALWMVDLPFVVVLVIGMIGGGVAAMMIELSIYRTLRIFAGAAHQYCRLDLGRFAHSAECGAPGLGIGAVALPCLFGGEASTSAALRFRRSSFGSSCLGSS